jgi:hypothetical protein
MPEKQKARNWKQTQTVIVVFAMTGILAIWNLLATLDREKPKDESEKYFWVVCTPTPGAKVELQPPSLFTPTPANQSETGCVTRTRSS